jgi:hypothetical protein
MSRASDFEEPFYKQLRDDSQVGGDHYTKYSISPYNFARINNLNPFQANVIKYAVRYLDKDTPDEKIKDYCEMELKVLKMKGVIGHGKS